MSVVVTVYTVTGPAAEPITVAEAKDHLGITDSTHDSYLGVAIRAARRSVERFLRRALITQTLEQVHDEVPPREVELRRAPVQSIVSVKAYNRSENETTLAGTDYSLYNRREPAVLRLADSVSWPSNLRPVEAVVIRMVCGYGASGSDVPADLRQGLLVMVADLFENRESVVIDKGQQVLQVPEVAQRLLEPYRLFF